MVSRFLFKIGSWVFVRWSRALQAIQCHTRRVEMASQPVADFAGNPIIRERPPRVLYTTA